MGKEITNLMINLFEMKKTDWFGFQLSKDNKYTYHHIKKACNGGKETLENGAILTEYAHRLLHILEDRDPKLYDYLNNILISINAQGFMPLERQLLAIRYILDIFFEKHKYDKNSKGKLLLRKYDLDKMIRK